MSTEPAPEPLPSHPDRAQIGGPMAATPSVTPDLRAALAEAISDHVDDHDFHPTPGYDDGYALCDERCATDIYNRLSAAALASVTPDLRALSDAASSGPWSLGRSTEDGENWHPQVWPAFGAPIASADGRPSGRPGAPQKDAADFALIVAAVNHVRAALASVTPSEPTLDAIRRQSFIDGYAARVVDDPDATPESVRLLADRYIDRPSRSRD